MDLMSRLFSPYHINPKGANPLREILARLVDFERLAQSPIKLFITATNLGDLGHMATLEARPANSSLFCKFGLDFVRYGSNVEDNAHSADKGTCFATGLRR
jgi:hypothetical protein